MENEAKAQAFDMFCKQIQQSIEEKIPDWLSDNPYWEIDGDDGKPAHCPPTTVKDAREAIIEDLLDKADNLGFYDFFELCINQTYGEAMGIKNIYRPKETPAETKNLMNTICTAHQHLFTQLEAAGEK